MSAPSSPSPDTGTSRPRIEGDREQEILGATLEVLAEVGYDRLTMDAIAHRAKASKATLYRRWNGKTALVIEALQSGKALGPVPDTGSLREDLLAAYCGVGGLATREASTAFLAVITALTHDAEFANAFRTEILAPKLAVGRRVFEQARQRGELRDDLDLDLVAPALAGIALHRLYVLGQPPERDTVTRIIDQIILPAALRPDAPLIA